MLIALESGWNLTALLSALTQVLLDPVYRTFDGFQTLIEREFLSFGHRFSHNGIRKVFTTFITSYRDNLLCPSIFYQIR